MIRKKKMYSKKITDKVLENIMSGSFEFELNNLKNKNTNAYRVKCRRDCSNCNLGVKHSSGVDCEWHANSDYCNIEFVDKGEYPELFI